MKDNLLRFTGLLGSLFLTAASADDDMTFLDERPRWNLDGRVFADRDGGRGGLIGVGWDTGHGVRLDLRRAVFNAGNDGLDSRQVLVGATTTSLSSWRLGLTADRTDYPDTLDVGRLTPRIAWLGDNWDVEFAPEFSRLAFARTGTITPDDTVDVSSQALAASATYFGFQDWMLSVNHYRARYSRDLSKVTKRLRQLGRVFGVSQLSTVDGLVSGLLATRSGFDAAYSWDRALIGAGYERAVSEADASVAKSVSLSLDWQQNSRIAWSAQWVRVRTDSEVNFTVSAGLRFMW